MSLDIKSELFILPQTVHIWEANLADAANEQQRDHYYALLNQEERQRAQRFRSIQDRYHFISARGLLRTILSSYLNMDAKQLVFDYTQYNKPVLSAAMNSAITFNLTHSYQYALYAIALNDAIGVDIEYIDTIDFKAIAKRYFCEEEYRALMALPYSAQLIGFYRLWSRKEALIKAIGKGLNLSLSSFRVSIMNTVESIMIGNYIWQLFPLYVHPHYQATVVTAPYIQHILYRIWPL